MEPFRLFRFCPRCGAHRGAPPEEPAPFRCGGCGLLYFFNPAASVAALVLDRDGRALFIRRGLEPARGKLALVGGFVDFGETAEAALRREVLEEVNLELGALRFLSSHTNEYRYEDVVYPVVDFFFVTRAANPARAAALDGVTAFAWMDPMTVDLADLAFPSMRRALEDYRRDQSRAIGQLSET
jgi:ADP-ribose pyrophosphatase YjhB (NUDIX family)